MKLHELDFSKDNYFIAMEYYWLILNRTLFITEHNNHLIGVVANGPVSARGGADPVTRGITSQLAIHGDLENPVSYLNERYLSRVENMDILSDQLLQSNRANFRYRFDEIISVVYDSTRKWGMGYYPHDGKVLIKAQGKTREFIILGGQSGLQISNRINEAIERAGMQGGYERYE